VFAGVYTLLHRRSGARVQWGWLAAIVGCAAFAFILGVLTL
jgi:hypothetical protein